MIKNHENNDGDWHRHQANLKHVTDETWPNGYLRESIMADHDTQLVNGHLP